MFRGNGIIMRGLSSREGEDHGEAECRRGFLVLSRVAGSAKATNRVRFAKGEDGNDSMKLQERRRPSSART